MDTARTELGIHESFTLNEGLEVQDYLLNFHSGEEESRRF